MTSQSDAKPSPNADEEEGGGLLPAIIVGAGILIVAALLIFDFGGGEEAKGDKAAAAAQGAKGKAGAGDRGDAAGAKGGVQSRPYDAAKGRPAGRINPAVLPAVGMNNQASAPPPEEVPTFANAAEEIAWLEKKLVGAKKIRDDRKKFVERLPKVKERIEASPNAEEGLKAFDGRKKIVEDNYDKAVKKVDEIEAKLAQLRGG